MKAPQPLLLVVQKLGHLRERVVFVGGMIRGLLTTDPAAGPARPTDDVDLIVPAVASLADYYALGVELRKLGFCEDSREGAPLCRWIIDGVTTDIMPIDPAVLGFSNVWYESAQRHISTTETPYGPLHHLDGPHFCATKLEAFAGRGEGDYYHHDLEDVVALIDERPTLIDEMVSSPRELREFMATGARDLLATPTFLEALPGHMSGDEVSQQRVPALVSKLQRIAALFELQPSADRSPQPRITTPAVTRPASHRPEASPMASPAGLSQVTRVAVRSSNLAWFEYDSARERLVIGFHRGGTYNYSNVPAQVYQGLLNAHSKGRYFNVWIKPRYSVGRGS